MGLGQASLRVGTRNGPIAHSGVQRCIHAAGNKDSLVVYLLLDGRLVTVPVSTIFTLLRDEITHALPI
jgi:hypothetical protein